MRLEGFNERVIGLYAGGMTVRDIRDHLAEVYGVEVSPDLISAGHRRGLHRVQTVAVPPVRGGFIRWSIWTRSCARSAMRVWCATRPLPWGVGVDVEGHEQVLGIWIETATGRPGSG